VQADPWRRDQWQGKERDHDIIFLVSEAYLQVGVQPWRFEVASSVFCSIVIVCFFVIDFEPYYV
jgi:hypothetical protein